MSKSDSKDKNLPDVIPEDIKSRAADAQKRYEETKKELREKYSFTGYHDDQGKKIYLGDTLRSEHGYDVIVIRGDKPGEFWGKLVCDDKHSCKDIPYRLNKGEGYTKIKDG